MIFRLKLCARNIALEYLSRDENLLMQQGVLAACSKNENKDIDVKSLKRTNRPWQKQKQNEHLGNVKLKTTCTKM